MISYQSLVAVIPLMWWLLPKTFLYEELDRICFVEMDTVNTLGFLEKSINSRAHHYIHGDYLRKDGTLNVIFSLGRFLHRRWNIKRPRDSPLLPVSVSQRFYQ